MTFVGRPVQLIAIEYRVLTELSTNGGRVVTYEHLLQRVWGERSSGDIHPMRTIVKKLRRKLGRRREQRHLHLHRAPRWLPDAEGGDAGAG